MTLFIGNGGNIVLFPYMLFLYYAEKLDSPQAFHHFLNNLVNLSGFMKIIKLFLLALSQ